MNDTSASALELWQKGIDSISPQERIEMACSMFAFSRDLVVESIQSLEPNISKKELRKMVLLRFYGDDFDEDILEGIAETQTPR
jgi:hypothetical protein